MSEPSKFMDWEEIKKMKGFERSEFFSRDTFKDRSTILIVPTRGVDAINPADGKTYRVPNIPIKVGEALNNLIKPMNQKFFPKWWAGAEVGEAYTEAVNMVLNNPELSTWKYFCAVEDDMILPPDALIRLYESIEAGPFDAVGGIYWTKGDYNMPQIYGDPEKFRNSGVLDFAPLDPRPYLAQGQSVVECNGTAMGCTLYRVQMFKDMVKAYGPNIKFFETVNDLTPDGPQCFTQDLKFASMAKKIGKRFAIDFRVRCGHLDIYTDTVY